MLIKSCLIRTGTDYKRHDVWRT